MAVRTAKQKSPYFPTSLKKAVYDVYIYEFIDEFYFYPHYQNSIELLFTTGARGTVGIDGRNYSADDQTLFCAGSGIVHGGRVAPLSGGKSGRGKLVVLQLEPEFFTETLGGIDGESGRGFADQMHRTRVVTGAAAVDIRRAIVGLSRYIEATRPSSGPDTPAETVAAGDLSLLFRIVSIILGEGPRTPEQTPPAHRRIRRIIDVIEANAGHEVSLDEIASMCSLSKFHLCRQFRQHAGITVIDYLNRTRIERAKRMLTLDDTRVSEVAEACGFASLSYFIRVFRRYTHTSPKQWIRRLSAESGDARLTDGTL